MSSEYFASVTVEEAVALLINIDHIPPGKSLLDLVAADEELASESFDSSAESVKTLSEADLASTAGALFESLFKQIREEVARSRASLASNLFQAFECEMRRPETSVLISVPNTSAVPRFTVESVNLWASENFGLHIPGMVKHEKARLFYQSPRTVSVDNDPATPAVYSAKEIPSTKQLRGTPGPVATDHLYVTLAYLTELFTKNRNDVRLPDGRVNISRTAQTLNSYIQEDPAARELDGQSVEAIKDRLENAQKVKRTKVNRG